tara:strand:+ start:238 stop:414 length:177 start_codon:yes stop_codon:yes gene_type:complete
MKQTNSSINLSGIIKEKSGNCNNLSEGVIKKLLEKYKPNEGPFTIKSMRNRKGKNALA